jgi:hypothetical protein
MGLNHVAVARERNSKTHDEGGVYRTVPGKEM